MLMTRPCHTGRAKKNKLHGGGGDIGHALGALSRPQQRAAEKNRLRYHAAPEGAGKIVTYGPRTSQS